MDNIEEEFFKTFGIEKNKLPAYCSDYIGHCIGCKYFRNSQRECYEYPEITDRILLELICILNETACEVLGAENIEDLKNEILGTCVKVYNTPILTSDGDEYDNYAIYDKIQQLFKGGEQQ